MKEIIELNEEVLKACSDWLPKDGIHFGGPEDEPRELERVPNEIRRMIRSFRDKLHSMMPDDFSYVLFLGGSEPSFWIEYENGAMSGGSVDADWKDDSSIFPQIEVIDWDEARANVIRGTESMDEMARAAATFPQNVPPTKILQKAFREDMSEFIKRQRKDQSQIHVLAFREDAGLQELGISSADRIVARIADYMTLGWQIVTVVKDGKPMPAKRIDVVKREALKSLEDMPISHAKASGRFDLMLGAMGYSEADGLEDE